MPAEKGTPESDLDESNPFKVFSVQRGEGTRHAVTHYRVMARTANGTASSSRLWKPAAAISSASNSPKSAAPSSATKNTKPAPIPPNALGLHACFLRFPHPVTGQELRFTSPLPRELARYVR